MDRYLDLFASDSSDLQYATTSVYAKMKKDNLWAEILHTAYCILLAQFNIIIAHHCYANLYPDPHKGYIWNCNASISNLCKIFTNNTFNFALKLIFND